MSRPDTGHGTRNMFEDPAIRAAWHVDRAQRLLEEGRNSAPELEKVIRELNVASSLVPNSYEIQLMFADAFRRSYDYSSAIFSLRMALHLHPSSHDAKRQLCEIHMVQGKELLACQRYEEAKANFDQAIKYNPRPIEVWLAQAVCCMFMGHLQLAMDCVTRAIEIAGPHNINLFILRAQLYWKMGMTTAGDMEMRIAEKIDPENPEVKKFIGRSFEVAASAYDHAVKEVEKGNLEGAIKPLEQAITLSPNDVKLHLLLAKVLRVLRRYQDAYVALQCAGNIFKERDEGLGQTPPRHHRHGHDSTSATPHEGSPGGSVGSFIESPDHASSGDVSSRGWDPSSDEEDDDDKADKRHGKPAFGRRLESMGSRFEDDHNSTAQRCMPAIISTQLNLLFNDMALDYATKGEVDKALHLLTKVIVSERERQGRPGGPRMDYHFFMNRGDLYRLRRDHPAAIADYTSALAIEPNAADVKAKLAIIKYEDGVGHFNDAQYDLCIEVISECINLSDSVCEYYVLRGRAKYYSHDFEGAHSDFRRAKELDPSNPYPDSYLAQFIDPSAENKQREENSNISAIEVPASTDETRRRGGKTMVVRALTYEEKRERERRRVVIERPEARDISNLAKSTSNKALAVSVFHALAATTGAIVAEGSGSTQPTSSVNDRPREAPSLIPAPRLSQEVTSSLIVASKVSRQLFLDTLAEPADLGASRQVITLIDTAGRVAAAALKGPEQMRQEQQAAKKRSKKKGEEEEKPSTAVALKRMSDTITKQRLRQVHSGDMTLVKGIVSSHNDPELVSLRQLQAMRRSKSSVEVGQPT